MSNLPGNPFAETHKVNGTLSEDDGEWAIAQATLALAYEQRNVALAIIATSTHPDGTYALNPAVVDEAQDHLKTRLGLGENNA